MAEVDTKQIITEKIVEQFDWDNRIASANIHVEVLDGVVILTGEVPNYSTRLAAEEDALSIFGVKQVQNNLLVKEPGATNIPTDNEIKKFIENRIRFDPRIDYETINVDVEKGVVSLDGTVNAHWKKEQAESYAHRVTGVVEVNNNIGVNVNKDLSDDQIKQEINNAFKRNILMDAGNIVIDVLNGEVRLSGFVPSYTAKMKARQIANHTTGVVNIINLLEVW
ncbi:MAG: BON domain-containing protein [Bacteroidota bacterium]|nr:BON domain-containing protein [Bacteroidota bacterium]